MFCQILPCAFHLFSAYSIKTQYHFRLFSFSKNNRYKTQMHAQNQNTNTKIKILIFFTFTHPEKQFMCLIYNNLYLYKKNTPPAFSAAGDSSIYLKLYQITIFPLFCFQSIRFTCFCFQVIQVS